MPYELSFTKRVDVANRDGYINDCCIGGDVVAERVLPAIRQRFAEAGEPVGEDWGWALWFPAGDGLLYVDIYCDDPATGEYRIHVGARKKRFLFLKDVADTPEVEELLRIVAGELAEWTGKLPTVAPV